MDALVTARSMAVLPWFTWTIAAVAVVFFQSPDLSSSLEFSRAAVDTGQIWRLWTSSLAHFSAGHLLWNVVVVVVFGSRTERIYPGLVRLYYIAAPAVIGCALLFITPNLGQFRGLSGVAAGLVALFALVAFHENRRRTGTAVALLLGIKITMETLSTRPLLASFEENIVSTPLAHWAGVAVAVVSYAVWHKINIRELRLPADRLAAR